MSKSKARRAGEVPLKAQLWELRELFDQAGHDPGHVYNIIIDLALVETKAHVRRSRASYYVAVAKVYACHLALGNLPKAVAAEIWDELDRSLTGRRSDNLNALLAHFINIEGTSGAVRKQRNRDRHAILCAEREGWDAEEFYAQLSKPGGGLEALAQRHRPARPKRSKPNLAENTPAPAPAKRTVPAVDGPVPFNSLDRLAWGKKPYSKKPAGSGYYAFIGELKDDGELRVKSIVSLGRKAPNKKNLKAFRKSAPRLLLTEPPATQHLPAKKITVQRANIDEGGRHA